MGDLAAEPAAEAPAADTARRGEGAGRHGEAEGGGGGVGGGGGGRDLPPDPLPPSSLDPRAVLWAAAGGEAAVHATRIRGDNWVDRNGHNFWNATRPGQPTPDRKQSILWLEGDNDEVDRKNWLIGQEIDELLCVPPRLNPDYTSMPDGAGVPYQPDPPWVGGDDEDASPPEDD